jgi:hypothetical protein
MSRYVAKHLRSRQKAWNEGTQRQVAAISMKAVKMLGVQQRLAEKVQALRRDELQAASKVRWMMVRYNASGLFGPLSQKCVMED